MKPSYIIPLVAAFCLASCAKDGDAAKKKSVSVGRFGVRHNTVAVAPEVAAAEAPAVEEKKPAESKPAAVDPVPAPPSGKKSEDEGIRLPNMLGMPEDRELKSTSPTAGGNAAADGGGVISRPPVEKKEE